jgi:hypothetical protein
MLDLFRNRGLSSIVMGAVIVATVLIFVIQFNPSVGKQAAKLTKTCAATVRGVCVEPKDHKAAYYLLIPQDPRTGERLVSRAKSMGLADTVLDGLVERQLLIGEAERLGLSASDEEITESIFSGFVRVSVPSDNPALAFSMNVKDGVLFDYYRTRAPVRFFRDPKTKEFDEKIYKRNLKALFDCSEIDFREWQQRELLAQKMRDIVKAPVRVSESEAMESYFAEKSQATVASVEVSPDFAIAFSEAPSDAEVEGWSKDTAHAKEIETALAARKSDPSAPKDGTIRHILIKVKPSASASEKQVALETLSRAVARVAHGETFAEVAKAVSQDDGSKPQGGSVGDKTDGFVLPFKQAADALKPGEMTPAAIETQFGYHIIVRDEPARFAKDVARELFVKQRAADWAKAASAKILASAQAGGSLEEAVKGVVSAQKPVTILQVVRDPSIVAPPMADAGAGDAGPVDVAPVAAPRTQLLAEADPEAPHVVTSSGFNQGSDPIPSLGAADSAKVLAFAFGSAKDGAVMSDVLRGGESYFVVALKQHKQATADEFAKDRETYTETLLGRKQNEALASYVKRLKDASKAEVKKDDAYLAPFHADAGVDDSQDQP